MIQNHHWRRATRAALKQAARDQDRSVSAIIRRAGIDRSVFETRHDNRGICFKTLAKLDAEGVCWKAIAVEAERLSKLMQKAEAA